MIDAYECEFCNIGVEYNTDDMQEYNEYKCCRSCFEIESDIGEVY